MNNMYPSNPLTMGNATFSPYYNSYQNPIVPNYPVIQQNTSHQRKVDCVNGIESAYTFPMGPNESVILVDNLSPRIFFVTTDASGYKAVKPFKISPDEDAASKPIEAEGVVEKEEDKIARLINRIDQLEERMNGYERPNADKSDRKYDGAVKPNGGNAQSNDRNSQGSKGPNGGH